MASPAQKKASHLRDFEQSLPMELLKAREAAMARFRPMLRSHGLTEQQWRVLRALDHADRQNHFVAPGDACAGDVVVDHPLERLVGGE